MVFVVAGISFYYGLLGVCALMAADPFGEILFRAIINQEQDHFEDDLSVCVLVPLHDSHCFLTFYFVACQSPFNRFARVVIKRRRRIFHDLKRRRIAELFRQREDRRNSLLRVLLKEFTFSDECLFPFRLFASFRPLLS